MTSLVDFSFSKIAFENTIMFCNVFVVSFCKLLKYLYPIVLTKVCNLNKNFDLGAVDQLSEKVIKFLS
jgi:hypothetical protein